MLEGTVLPSWFEIEERLLFEIRSAGQGKFRGYFNEHLPSISTVLRRLDHIRTAFHRAEFEAAYLLRQRFADLDIGEVVQELLGTVGQMALIVVGSVLAGGVIGAGAGALAGGAGAVPGGLAGMGVGLQASGWILTALGLASIAEYFVNGLPVLLDHYLVGIQVVWDGISGDEGRNPFGENDLLVVQRATHHFARGHIEVVVLLLSAIVDYLTRGRGGIGQLAAEMRGSRHGKRLAQWMIKHEEALKKRPDLHSTQPPRGSFGSEESTPPHRQNEQTAGRKPLGMPEHKVPCFSADNLHYSKIPEFDRQLGGQEKGLNDLTVDEYLQGREAYTAGEKVRDPNVAKRARKKLEKVYIRKLRIELERQKHSASEAMKMAEKLAKEKMAVLAALHNPDLFAGGKDTIADFGDRRVNSSIGSQWRGRILGLDEAVRRLKSAGASTTKINARLVRCQ